MSTKSHDAKKAREQNMSFSKQNNMKKKRQEELSSQMLSPEEARVNNNASGQRQQ